MRTAKSFSINWNEWDFTVFGNRSSSNIVLPQDLKELYGPNGGSIYGVARDRKKNGGFKIPSKSDLYEGLYFVGGSTHPGGGVPMVTLSGQLTADLIRKHEGAVPTP
nr:hypothetical protein [Exiguobacterium sp. SL14]